MTSDLQQERDSRASQDESATAARDGFVSPSDEPPPAELFDRARAAVIALRGRGRQRNGRAGVGNTLSLKTGLRSTRLLDVPDIATWHQAEVAAIAIDLGGADELTTLAKASVRETARLEVILGALGDELLSHGVLTGKGKMRASTTVYLKVLDRFVKCASLLGLERRARRLPASPMEALAEVDDVE